MEMKTPQTFKFKTIEKEGNKENNSISVEVAEVAECFMNAAKSLHKLHLKITSQGSYAAHVALGGYDKFHDFVDSLVEAFQGAEGMLLSIPSTQERKLNTVKEAIEFLDYIKEEVTDLQSKLKYSEIINQLDLVKEHCNGMKYKLKFLS